jgi:hypothetical protein
VDPDALARAIEVTLTGSLMAWGLYQEGAARSWIRHDLESLLRPFLTRRARSQAGNAAKSRKRTRPKGGAARARACKLPTRTRN